jgi:DNA-binding transcriptional ArsR family regulator
MPVPPEQLSALASLDSEKSVRRLAQDNGSPYPSMQKAVNTLEKGGLVTTTRQGRERLVKAASTQLASLARALIFDAPRQDWRSIFHGERLVLLHVLDRVRDPALVAEVCNVARTTVYHAIRTLAPSGLLLKDGDGYRVNPRLVEFRAFLLEWNTVRATKAVHDFDPKATGLWRLGPELMFRSRTQVVAPHVHLGATSAMAQLGAPVVEKTEATTYYVSRRRLTSSDAVLQAMVMDGNNTAESGLPPAKSVRAQWTAFIETRVPRESYPDLERRAKIYGKVPEVQAILAYLSNHDEAGFLAWTEYERFRQQFGATP